MSRDRPKSVGGTPRVLVVQTYVPQYRVAFFEGLRTHLANQGVHLDLIYSDPPADAAIKRDAVKLEWAIYLPNRNIGIGNRTLTYQPVAGLAGAYELVIVEQANKLLVNPIPPALVLEQEYSLHCQSPSSPQETVTEVNDSSPQGCVQPPPWHVVPAFGGVEGHLIGQQPWRAQVVGHDLVRVGSRDHQTVQVVSEEVGGYIQFAHMSSRSSSPGTRAQASNFWPRSYYDGFMRQTQMIHEANRRQTIGTPHCSRRQCLGYRG